MTVHIRSFRRNIAIICLLIRELLRAGFAEVAVLGRGIAVVAQADDQEASVVLWNRYGLRIARKARPESAEHALGVRS